MPRLPRTSKAAQLKRAKAELKKAAAGFPITKVLKRVGKIARTIGQEGPKVKEVKKDFRENLRDRKLRLERAIQGEF